MSRHLADCPIGEPIDLADFRKMLAAEGFDPVCGEITPLRDRVEEMVTFANGKLSRNSAYAWCADYRDHHDLTLMLLTKDIAWAVRRVFQYQNDVAAIKDKFPEENHADLIDSAREYLMNDLFSRGSK